MLALATQRTNLGYWTFNSSTKMNERNVYAQLIQHISIRYTKRNNKIRPSQSHEAYKAISNSNAWKYFHSIINSLTSRHTSTPRNVSPVSATGTYLSSICTRITVLSVCDRRLGSLWDGSHRWTTVPSSPTLGDQPFQPFAPPTVRHSSFGQITSARRALLMLLYICEVSVIFREHKTNMTQIHRESKKHTT